MVFRSGSSNGGRGGRGGCWMGGSGARCRGEAMTMNDDLKILVNEISGEGMRRVHVMAERPYRVIITSQVPPTIMWRRRDGVIEMVVPPWAKVKRWEDEIRLQHLEASWKAREAIYFDFSSCGGEAKRPVVAWWLNGMRISEGIVEAGLTFRAAFGYWPSAAWVRTWPKGLKNEEAFVPLGYGVGLDLFAVEWGWEGFVIVGGRSLGLTSL